MLFFWLAIEESVANPKIAYTLGRAWAYFWDLLLGRLRQNVQNVELTGILATKFSVFRTYWTFLRQSFQDFDPSSTSTTWARLPQKIDLLSCWPPHPAMGDYCNRDETLPSRLSSFVDNV